MRVFQLHRDVDETGSSGTGVVVQGIEFDDGTIALRWLTGTTSTAVYDSIDDVIEIHGHGGATRVVWLGYGGQPLADTPQPVDVTQRGFGIWLKGLEDLDGQQIDVLTSSLATDDAVRVYVKGNDLAGLSAGAAHLNAAQAVGVRDALNAWLLWVGDAAATNPIEVPDRG